ncbi:Caspase b [Labeo rohita]|uniref:Caspase b n=1 Tax=Labeo rohita TaxID=84645 RepID=A0ABQ8L1A2_LABRO|nr:Caspase b [Labeo rohita]
MASVKEMLMGSMKELVEAELKAFKWHLMNPSYKHIPRSELEKADIFDTVDKMIACFGPEEAVKVTVDILRKMNQNELAKQLENKHKQETDWMMVRSDLCGALAVVRLLVQTKISLDYYN